MIKLLILILRQYNLFLNAPFAFVFVPNRYKTHEISNKVVSKETFMLKYCLDRHKTQEMCDKVVDACLPALKLAPDWFITNKMIEKHVSAAFTKGPYIKYVVGGPEGFCGGHEIF